MKSALTLTLIALGLASLAALASATYAQTERIELTEANPPDGAWLNAPPETVRLCFSQLIRGDFRIRYKLPNGSNLGLRIAFLPNGSCLDIQPTLPDDPPEGDYTLEWQVTEAEGGPGASGELRFRIDEGGSPPPSPAPTPSETPPPATPPAGGDPDTAPADDDGGPDILLTALVTTASVGGAAVLLTLGYLLRRRIGFEPHRPPPGDEDGGEGEEH